MCAKMHASEPKNHGVWDLADHATVTIVNCSYMHAATHLCSSKLLQKHFKAELGQGIEGLRSHAM